MENNLHYARLLNYEIAVLKKMERDYRKKTKRPIHLIAMEEETESLQ